MTAGGLIGFAGDLPYTQQIDLCVRAVERGTLSRSRLDDAVKRNLRVKMAMGLLPRASGNVTPPPPTGELKAELEACVGCDAHRALARRAVRGSAVLLKNRDCVLPLSAETMERSGLAVTGEGADDLGMQCGGWSLSWMGRRGNAFTDGTTIWQAVSKLCPSASLIAPPSVLGFAQRLSAWAWQLATPRAVQRAQTVLVVVGEGPYAEGGGDTHAARMKSSDAALIAALAAGGSRRIVVVLICGRPLVIPPKTLELIDALLVAWLPGTEGDGVADALFGRGPQTGRLSYSWPHDASQMHVKARQDGKPLFAREAGLTYSLGGTDAAL